MREETEEFGVEAEGVEEPVLLLLLFRPGGALPDMLEAERCCDDEPCLRPLLLVFVFTLLLLSPASLLLLLPPSPGGSPPLIAMTVGRYAGALLCIRSCLSNLLLMLAVTGLHCCCCLDPRDAWTGLTGHCTA